jgi:lipopolysaccharide/colanic/teichoic acid biosynthesis glycosyltransferase
MNDLLSEPSLITQDPLIDAQDALRDAIEMYPRKISKIVMDFVLTIVILAPAFPFLMLVALCIKIDSPGPVFFRQPRIGLNNKVFLVWKFRTMRNDVCDVHGSRLTERDDPRITRLGAWLRKWSIDELPQMFNVLTGEMSLVGPRPHPLNATAAGCLYADVVIGYARRHVVKPGITGWAQVNGWRGETTTAHQIEQRVVFDMEYIRRQSLTFDLWIILLTVVREIRSKKAF